MGSNPDLTDRVEQLANRVDELEAENDRLRDDVDDLQEENAELRKRVDVAESRLDAIASEQESRAAVRWEGGNPGDAELEAAGESEQTYPIGRAVASKLSENDVETQLGFGLEELRDRLDSGDLAEAGDDATVDTETALEDTVALPEHVAEDALTKNQQRARFLASDVAQFGVSQSKHAYTLSSDRVNRVLAAASEEKEPGERMHPETVRRVMDVFEKLGGDDVSMAKRGGMRQLRVTKDAAKRLATCREAHIAVSDVPA